MTNEALTLQLREHGQRLFNRTVTGSRDAADPKIDDIQRLAAEISEVVERTVDQLLTREGRKPALVVATTSAELGHDHETFGIWMKRLLDQPVGHVRTIEVARVDVVHAGVNGLPQHRNGRVNVARRSPDMRTSQLHGSIAHSIQRHRGPGQREAASEVCLLKHAFVPSAVFEAAACIGQPACGFASLERVCTRISL